MMYGVTGEGKVKSGQEQGRPSTEVNLSALRRSVLYSEELGIRLQGSADEEVFKWFLASVLFGARISGSTAEKTYHSFERHNLLDPRSILDAGWDYLVDPVMREGGYVRYDEKTSREILKNCEMLLGEYRGSLNRLHGLAADGSDLERRLLAFYGVGPVTVNIFLRELRPYWAKADPQPLPIVLQVAGRYRIDLTSLSRKSLAFTRVEAGLVRLKGTLRGRQGRKGTEAG